MNEELEVLKLVAKRLEEADIAYMVTGSVAMNFYATPRMTRDIDIVIEISEPDVSRFVVLFRSEFYIDKNMIFEALRTQRMFNIIHNDFVIKIDFIIRKKSKYWQVEFGRRRTVEIDSQTLWIVSPEDLILSKLWWAKDSNSTMQITDARNIFRQVHAIDRTYLEQWVKELNLTDIYKEL